MYKKIMIGLLAGVVMLGAAPASARAGEPEIVFMAEAETKDDGIRLASPTDVKRDGCLIGWSPVQNATIYGLSIRIGDGGSGDLTCYTSTTDTKIDLTSILEKKLAEYCEKNGANEAEIRVSLTADNDSDPQYLAGESVDVPVFTMTLSDGKSENVISVPELIERAYSDKEQTVKLEATCLGGAKLSYRSMTPGIKVSAEGKVTIPKQFTGNGVVLVSAAACEEFYEISTFVTVRVEPVISVKDVTKKASASDKVYTLDAVVKKGKASLEYSCDSDAISVNEKGKVSVPAFFTGTATITVTAWAGGDPMVEKQVTLTVEPLKENVITTSVDEAEGLIERKYSDKKQVVELKTKVLGKAKVKYESSDPKIKVSGAGKITIPAKYRPEGLVNITIRTAETDAYYPAETQVQLNVCRTENTITIASIHRKTSGEDRVVELDRLTTYKGSANLEFRLIRCAGADGNELTVSKNGLMKIPAGFVGSAVLKASTDESHAYLPAEKLFTVTIRPDAPTVKAANGGNQSLKVTWPAVTGADHYVVQIATNSKFTTGLREVVAEGELSCLVEGLKADKTYHVRVAAAYGTGEMAVKSEWSSTKKVTIKKAADGRTVVSKNKIYDCDGSGHGYWRIEYSDGTIEYIDF